MNAAPIRFAALNGSERTHGSTAECLGRAAEHLRARGTQVTVIDLADRRIETCRCGRCNSRPDPCPVADDVAAILRDLCAADAVIYATPVHGYGMAATMQAFIERAGVGHLRFDRPLTNKVGGAVVVGRRYAHVGVHAQLVHNLLLNRMIVVGSGFPVTIHAGEPHGVDGDPEGLDAMYRTLDRMHDMADLLRRAPARLTMPESTELRHGMR